MKPQWFDELFQANKEYPLPSRESTDIETVEYYAKKQAELDAEPKSYVDLIRKQEPAF